MYSFYGGRPGNSFVLVTTYRSKQEMIDKFKLGPDYTTVHYDQYVMINSANKNDPDNGSIYRRGYDFNGKDGDGNDTGGAIYIGTIAGPAGRAPILELTTIAQAQQKHSESQQEQYEERQYSGSYNISNGSLVPGRIVEQTEEEQEEIFNDEIKWYGCSIKNESGEDCEAYIGFTFPYLVVDFTSETGTPYQKASVTREDDGQHPYYEKFQITIPKGIKGDSIKNLKVETASHDIQDYENQNDDVENQRKVLVYEYYDYSNSAEGTLKKLYLGKYNMIDSISIEENGDVTINYTHDDPVTFENVFKTIQSVSLNEENGNFTILYNFGEVYGTQLNWVKDVSMASDGTVTIDYTKEPSKICEDKLKWIKNIDVADDGTLSIIYNDDTKATFDKKIKWVDYVNIANDGEILLKYNNSQIIESLGLIKQINNIVINPDDGTLVFQYNYGDPDEFSMKWISDINLSDSGNLTVNYYNTIGSKSLGSISWINNIYTDSDGKVKIIWNNRPEQELAEFRWINDISLNTGSTQGEGNQKLTITWNDDSTTEIGNPINYIMETAISDNHHFLVRYSDPERRAAGGVTWDGKDGWTDLGTVLINQIESGETYPNLGWNGLSSVVSSGIEGSNKLLSFTITPTKMISDDVSAIYVQSGQLYATMTESRPDSNVDETVEVVISMDSTNTTVAKTLTGLEFTVETDVTASGSAVSAQYAQVVIKNMSLLFS